MQDPDNKLPQPVGTEPPLRPNVPDAPSAQPQNTPLQPPAWFTEPVSGGGQSPVASKPKKKGRTIALIIAILVVILGAGGALAYQFWYQNPEKVVTDSIVNAIKAKSIRYTGSLVTTGGQAVKVTFNGKGEGVLNEVNAEVTVKNGEKDIVFEGAVLTDSKGDLYFKVKNIDSIVKQYAPVDEKSDPETKKLVDTLVGKINNQWIKVASEDLKSVSESTSKTQSCFKQAVEKIEGDKAVSSELTDTYKKHRFIDIKDELGSKDGSLGYDLSFNKDVAKAFAKDVKNTQIYKTLQSCDKSFTIDEKELFNDSEDSTKTTVQLWVSQFSHEVTKLNIEGVQDKDKATMLFEPTFNEKIDGIATPEKSTTIKQLQSDFEELLQSAMGVSQFEEELSSEL